MIKGTVKFFNGTKGFGFITPDDGSKEVFVPTATVTASGESSLKAGQRVSFEAEQEARGPKAVKLTLLDEPLREIVRDTARETVREMVRETSRPGATLYYETDDEDAADVMAALSAAGFATRHVDYIVTPPPREELKKLSVMLREANQPLARRYEPLFMELQLDDRFISESEFLTGIHEHPTLINGPILVWSGKARICRTAEDVLAFLGNGAAEEKRAKGISPRVAAMMQGKAVPPAPPRTEEAEEEDAEEDVKLAAPPLAPVAAKPVIAAAKPAPRPEPKSEPRFEPKLEPKVEPKPERQPELDLDLAPRPKVKLAPRAKKPVVVEKAPAKKATAKPAAKPAKTVKAAKAKPAAKPVKKAKK
jgi:CspA family cold shock protein